MELVKKSVYQIFIVHYISLRCFQFCHLSFSTEPVKFCTNRGIIIKKYVNQIFNVYYIFRYSIIFTTLFCSVLNLETEVF
jgi:hypothetical protein